MIEGVPGERVTQVIHRALKEREGSSSDMILRLEINGVMKEVILTKDSTRQSISSALYE